MSRSFTTREKVLIFVLVAIVVGCFYYFAVFSPSMATINSAETKLTTAQDSLLLEQTKYQQMQKMQTAIDEAKASGEFKKTVPDYDNTKAEMVELNSILSSATTYTITFGNPTLDGTVVRRPVTISFTANTYDEAETVLRSLLNGKYSCLVSDFSVKLSGSKSTSSSSSSSSTGNVSAGVEAIMFEKATDQAQADLSSDASNTSNTSKKSN